MESGGGEGRRKEEREGESDRGSEREHTDKTSSQFMSAGAFHVSSVLCLARNND